MQYYKHLFVHIFLSLTSFIVKVQCVIHITSKICVDQLFMLMVKLPVNRGQLVVKFWRSRKGYAGFLLHGVGDKHPEPQRRPRADCVVV